MKLAIKVSCEMVFNYDSSNRDDPQFESSFLYEEWARADAKDQFAEEVKAGLHNVKVEVTNEKEKS